MWALDSGYFPGQSEVPGVPGRSIETMDLIMCPMPILKRFSDHNLRSKGVLGLRRGLRQNVQKDCLVGSISRVSASSRSYNLVRALTVEHEGIENTRTKPFYVNVAARFCDALERFSLQSFYGDTKPKNFFMNGPFKPVEEFGPEQVLVVKGELPVCLNNGIFIRVGPNPRHEPLAKYHWFDGDGMMHGMAFKDGQVTYVSRYVRTSRFKQEEYWGAPKFLKMADLDGRKSLAALFLQWLRGSLGVLNTTEGTGTANTACVFHNKKLLCLNETDMPYMIKVHEDCDLETIGRFNFDDKLTHNCTGHPKIDYDTGEMFIFGWDMFHSPHAQYRVISKDGLMGAAVPLSLHGLPSPMHDFAITKNYTLFINSPFNFSLTSLVVMNQPAILFDNTEPLWIGVLPRYANDESEMKWFSVSTGAINHTANAWEEGDEIVLYAPRFNTFQWTLLGDYDFEKGREVKSNLWEYRLNMKTGVATEKKLGGYFDDCPGTIVEFPRINDKFMGRKNRFIYMSIMEHSNVTGVVKYDLTENPSERNNEARIYRYGDRRCGSEPIFVPNRSRGMDVELEEDDGYLLLFVHDENTGNSEMIVLDAKTMSSDPVAIVQVPARIPVTFHGLFVNEDQLFSQTSQ